jgi:hypothetical protein
MFVVFDLLIALKTVRIILIGFGASEQAVGGKEWTMISRGKLRLFQFMFIASLALALAGREQSSTLKTARSLEAAKALAKKEDYKRAILELRNSLEATPKNAEIYYQLAWHMGRPLISSYPVPPGIGAFGWDPATGSTTPGVSSSMPRERAGLRPPAIGQRRPMPAKTEPQFSPAMTTGLKPIGGVEIEG